MIGIIGYGRFGKLTVRNLAADFKVVVHTRDTAKADVLRKYGSELVSLEKACAQRVVILCVPISAMQTTLDRIAPLLKPGTLVVDVCSVKVYPVKWMTALLPKHVNILATHPMFGPDSAAESLAGHKIVLCPQRLEAGCYADIKKWLKDKKLVVIETTPEEHDRKIADSLALTHFIGRSLAELGTVPLDIDTEGYKRLLHILGVVTNDTWQLFEDMHRYNPYAAQRRLEFINALRKIDADLKNRSTSSG